MDARQQQQERMCVDCRAATNETETNIQHENWYATDSKRDEKKIKDESKRSRPNESEREPTAYHTHKCGIVI